jgi:hypothetical protein
MYHHSPLMATEEDVDYWAEDLESLGLNIRLDALNEFNDRFELSNLCQIIKQRLYKKYKAVYSE